LTRADISAGMAKVQSKAMGCSASSSAKGKVRVDIKVAGSGAVSGVTVLESPDPALGACVVSAVKKATFARTRTGGSFKIPYRF
jgi:TonB family protein